MELTFLEWYQSIPTRLDPVIFSIGSFRLQYYGLMYIVGFTLTYFIARSRLKNESDRFPFNAQVLMDLMTYGIVGLMVGARLGYVVFYHPGYYLSNPFEIILPFRFRGGIEFVGFSGMSYHGGLIGVLVGALLYARKSGINFWRMADWIAPAAPLGYTFGRLGNFINGELWGRVTDHPIGMYFPAAPTVELRHPSQLYEAFFEGIVLFAVLWAIRRRKLFPEGTMLAFYIFGYGFVRFFIEFYRQPDSHLGFIFAFFSMGQILCMGMMIFAVGLYVYLNKRKQQLQAAGHADGTLPVPDLRFVDEEPEKKKKKKKKKK